MGKEKAPKVQKGAIEDLLGNAISVPQANGELLIIPGDKAANKIANMIMAAKIRSLIESSVRTYKEKDMLPTPKDLKDLAEAAKSLNSMTGELYKEDGETPLSTATSKNKIIKVEPADDIDFSKPVDPKPDGTEQAKAD